MLSRENCGYYSQFATILNEYTHKNPHTEKGRLSGFASDQSTTRLQYRQ